MKVLLHSLEYCQKHFVSDEDGDFWYGVYEMECWNEDRETGTKTNFCFHKIDVGKAVVYSIFELQDWMIERELDEIKDAEYYV